MPAKTTIKIGEEHDKTAYDALRRVLLSEGARVEDEFWGVGGSQEVSWWKVVIENKAIEITAETYRGLTITGSAELVSRLAAAISDTKAD